MTQHDTQSTPNPLSTRRPEGTREPNRNGPTGQPLVEQGAKIAEDVRELGSIALEQAGQALQSAKQRGGDAVQNVKTQGREALDKSMESAGEWRFRAERAIADNPLKSVLIAVGVGACLGIGLRRR